MENKLRIAIPKGSLEEGTFSLFKQADLPIIKRGNRDYNLSIKDPRISEIMILRPQEIAGYVEEGEFDLGITGRDWIVETKAIVEEVADLQFSRGGWNMVRIVLAADKNNPVKSIVEIDADAKVVTEYPNITKRYFKRIGKEKARIIMSYGATEIKVPRLAEYLVDVTETGTTLQTNGKKILDVILKSSTRLIANKKSWANPKKRQAIEEIKELLLGVIQAKGKVLIKMNVAEKNLQSLLKYLPALESPTYSPLFSRDNAEKKFSVETVVEKSKLNIIIPEVRKLGAKGILEIDVSKIIP